MEKTQVSPPQNLTDYFNSQAVTYQDNSNRLPWSWLRLREARAVDRMMGSVRGHSVLDLGSGAGFYTRRFVDQGAENITAVDISQKMLSQFDGLPIESVAEDAAIVELSGKFDRILCAGVLEFVPDSLKLLKNAYRHAEDGARLVILAPRQNQTGRLYRRFHHRHGLDIKLFTLAELMSVAAGAGWMTTAHSFVFPFSWVLRCDAVVEKGNA